MNEDEPKVSFHFGKPHGFYIDRDDDGSLHAHLLSGEEIDPEPILDALGFAGDMLRDDEL